jgi:hypothetical protein
LLGGQLFGLPHSKLGTDQAPVRQVVLQLMSVHVCRLCMVKSCCAIKVTVRAYMPEGVYMPSNTYDYRRLKACQIT